MMVQFTLAYSVEHKMACAEKCATVFSQPCKRIKSSAESAICCSKWIRIVEHPLATNSPADQGIKQHAVQQQSNL